VKEEELIEVWLLCPHCKGMLQIQVDEHFPIPCNCSFGIHPGYVSKLVKRRRRELGNEIHESTQ